MGKNDERRALFEQVIKLRRAERAAPAVREILEVRAALERRIGSAFSVSMAADILSLTPNALFRHIKAGDIPVVLDERLKAKVPLEVLADLYEEVTENRARGRRHPLEPVVDKARGDAQKLRATLASGKRGASPDVHDRSGARALAYHRAVADKLTREIADRALHRVWDWSDQGRIAPEYAGRWDTLLRRPLAEIEREIVRPDQEMRDLRQSSPFAGTLSEPERRAIIELVR